jgi:hypothetical protein
MWKCAAVAKGSEGGYISGPYYRKKVTIGKPGSAKAGIELPLSSRDRQGWLDLFHVGCCAHVGDFED